ALGVLLYEVLTGRAPFQGATDVEILRRVTGTEPVPPRRQRRDLPRDLETISLKCLEKEPRRRYASARELAEDLKHWLAGEPIRARPAGLGWRLQRWARGHPVLVTAAVMLVVLAPFLAARPRPASRPEAEPDNALARAE